MTQASNKVVISTHGGAAGLVTYWTLNGMVDINKLAPRLTEAGVGIDQHPKCPTPQEILRRVCGSLSGRKQGRILDKRGDKFIFVAAVNDDDDYQAELSVYWSHEREDLVFSKENAPLAMQIRGAFGELSEGLEGAEEHVFGIGESETGHDFLGGGGGECGA